MQKAGIVIANGNTILTHITEMWRQDRDRYERVAGRRIAAISRPRKDRKKQKKRKFDLKRQGIGASRSVKRIRVKVARKCCG